MAIFLLPALSDVPHAVTDPATTAPLSGSGLISSLRCTRGVVPRRETERRKAVQDVA